MKFDVEGFTTYSSAEGLVPVDIDMRLAGAPVRLKGNGSPQAKIKDVNGDSFDDLEVHVEINQLELTANDTSATLLAVAPPLNQVIQGLLEAQPLQ